MSYDPSRFLGYLSRCRFEIGLFEENENEKIKIFSENEQGDVFESETSLDNAIKLIEYGNLSEPGRFFLDRCLFKASKILEREIDKTIDAIFEKEIRESEIENDMRMIAIKINDMIKREAKTQLAEESRLSSFFSEENAKATYVDLEKAFSKIKCRIKISG